MIPSRYDDPSGEYGIEVTFSGKEEIRRAKYPHRCCVCGRTIRPGRQYTRVFAVVDGQPQVQKFHGTVVGSCLDPWGNPWKA